MSKRLIAVAVLGMLSTGPAALAQGGQQQKQPSKMERAEMGAERAEKGAVEMFKHGPWTRKPTNEGKAKKEITQFINQEMEIQKKGDFNAALDRIDFPVFMTTDDAQGMVQAQSVDRAQFSSMMKPMFEQSPKDLKLTHKPDIVMLSDSLAQVTDSFTMTTGGKKYSGKSASVLIKRDGQWKWKSLTEAGWGGMEERGVGGSGTEGMEGSGVQEGQRKPLRRQ